MKSRFAKIVLMVIVINIAANAAMAGLFSPFSFSFFTPGLNQWFLLPFSLAGCV